MICGIGLAIVLAGHATNADWVGFRGPGALGVSDVKGLVVIIWLIAACYKA